MNLKPFFDSAKPYCYLYMFLSLQMLWVPFLANPVAPRNQIYGPQYHCKIFDFCRWSVAQEDLVLIRKGVAERQNNSSHGFQAAGISFLDPSNGQR